MKNFINVSFWRAKQIMNVSSHTDFNYLRILKSVYRTVQLSDMGTHFGGIFNLDVALSITRYFEDVVSGIGMWRAFTDKHLELYGKRLPFYDIDESYYYPDEVNEEDIRLLIWMSYQNFEEGALLNPENSYFVELAYKIYNILYAEFEKVPMNTVLTDLLQNRDSYKDFYFVKALCTNLIYTSYLFASPLIEASEEEYNTYRASYGKNVSEEIIKYAIRSDKLFLLETGPLALNSNIWLSGMLKSYGFEEESANVAGIQVKRMATYKILDADASKLTLAGYDGEKYEIERDSFHDLKEDSLNNNMLFTSLVKYNGEWFPNGITSFFYEEEFFDEVKNKYFEKKAQIDSKKNICRKLMEANGGYPFTYFANYDDMKKWLGKVIGISKDYKAPDNVEKMVNISVFADPDYGVTIVPNGALGIKDSRNPFYDAAEAEKESLEILVSPEKSTSSMLQYLLQHKMLPDAKFNSTKGAEYGRRLMQENIDFVARFIR